VDLKLASHSLQDVRIPVLWGNRAIVQERDGALSVIDVGGWMPRLEILRNQPAPGIGFRFTWGGFQIMSYPSDVYEFNIREKTFSSQTFGLPDVQIDEFYVRVGTQIYPNFGGVEGAVGIHVMPSGVQLGAPMPFPLFSIVDRGSRVT
jgi:hypothetical protein